MSFSVNNFDKTCRICASEFIFTCGIDIFTAGLYLDRKIYRYLYIDIRPDDNLPKTICATCFIKIESIDKFAYMATKTQEAFQKWLAKSEQQQLDALPSNAPFECITNISKTMATSQANNEEAIKKIIMKTFKNPRNPRHVDHVTLEQIINDQIVKNAKIPLKVTDHDETTNSYEPPEIMPIIEFNDLKLGQLIKDKELLDLILKSLKWMNDSTQYDSVLAKLKNSSLKEVLSNTNLLKDEDIMKLIRSYVGHDSNLNPASTLPQYSITKIESPTENADSDEVSQMEVSVDPNLFFPYDDEDEEKERKKESVEIVPLPIQVELPSMETEEVVILPFKADMKHAEAEEPTVKHENTGTLICTSCPSTYTSATDLQHHVLTEHLIKKSDHPDTVATKKPAKPSERKRRSKKRERKKNNTFTCPICQINLSTKGNLKVHIERGAHKPKEKFSCDDCKKLFKTVANLERHKRCHHSAEHKKEQRPAPTATCSLCDQTFTQNKDLKFHMKNEHNEENPNKCYCGKIFVNQRHCEAHQKRMHAEIE